MFIANTGKSRWAGFTIVELLIVVVVIAILAAVTIVAYNGVSQSAEKSALKSDLHQIATKLGIAKTSSNDTYPLELPEELSKAGVNTKLIYTRSSNTGFCLSAASIKKEEVAFNITEAGDINDGYCEGHYSPIATTNAACFTFNSGTITDYRYHEDNDINAPTCPRDVGIPSSIGGVEVTSIGEEAFRSNSLTSVHIPNSVTNIGYRAFRTNDLTSVSIPSSVTTIEDAAFNRNKLVSVFIPSSITTIGNYVFQDNQLTSISIPSSVTSIGTSAFYGNQLTSVVIPDSVTTIGSYAFQYNTLASITIPVSVISLGNYTFRNNQLTTVSIPLSTSFSPSSAFDPGVIVNRY